MQTGELLPSFSFSGDWFRWQTPLCLLITVAPAIAGAAVLSNRRGDGEVGVLRYADAWALCFRGMNPLVLLGYRAIVVLLLSFVFAVFLARRGLILEFCFYTQWTFLLVIIYFLIGASISAHGCWLYYSNPKRKENIGENRILKIEEGENVNLQSSLISRDNNNDNDRYERAGILGCSMQIIYQICGGAVMLTDVVFWCLLAPFMQSNHFNVNLVMGCMHSLNLIFLLIDTALNSMPFPMFGMAYFVIWSCIYVIFQWVLHLCGFSWWPYPFLDLSSPWAPLWYIIMAIVHIPCYAIYWLIVKAKNTYFPRFFPNIYVRSD